MRRCGCQAGDPAAAVWHLHKCNPASSKVRRTRCCCMVLSQAHHTLYLNNRNSTNVMPATIATKMTALSSAPPSFCPAESPACSGKAQEQVQAASLCQPGRRAAASTDTAMLQQGWMLGVSASRNCPLSAAAHSSACCGLQPVCLHVHLSNYIFVLQAQPWWKLLLQAPVTVAREAMPVAVTADSAAVLLPACWSIWHPWQTSAALLACSS